MQNFVSKVTITAVDKVSPVTKAIEKSLMSLNATNAKLSTGFENVTFAASDFGNKLKSIAVITAGVITAAGLITAKYADNAEKLELMAQRTGVSTTQLQRFGYVAGQIGLDADSMANSFKFLNRAIAEAGSNTASEAFAAFNALGVSVTDVDGKLKSADKVLLEISDKFKSSADGAVKVKTALTLMGRSGTDLIPLLNQGSDAIENLGNRFEKLGYLISEAEITRAAKFDDSLRDITVAFRGITTMIASSLVPVLEPLVEKFNEFVMSNKELIKLTVLDYIGKFISGLQWLWQTAATIGSVFSRVTSILGGFENVLLLLAGAKIAQLALSFIGLTKAVVSLGIAFATTPIGAFITALLAVGYAVYEIDKAFPNLGKTIVGTVKIMVKEVTDFFSKLESYWLKIERLYNKVTGKKTQETGTPPAVQKLMTAQDYKNIGGGGSSEPLATPAAANDAGGGFTGMLESIKSSINSAKKQMDLNIKLDTQNKVTAVSMDSVDWGNIDIATGSMYG